MAEPAEALPCRPQSAPMHCVLPGTGVVSVVCAEVSIDKPNAPINTRVTSVFLIINPVSTEPVSNKLAAAMASVRLFPSGASPCHLVLRTAEAWLACTKTTSAGLFQWCCWLGDHTLLLRAEQTLSLENQSLVASLTRILWSAAPPSAKTARSRGGCGPSQFERRKNSPRSTGRQTIRRTRKSFATPLANLAFSMACGTFSSLSD